MNTNYKLTPWINYMDMKALFWLEITDGINYFTTSSDSEYWKLNDNIHKINNSFFIKRGKTYKISVSRKDDNYTITYKDEIGNKLFNSLICSDVKFSNPKVYIKNFTGIAIVTINNNTETVYGEDEYPTISNISNPIKINNGDNIEFTYSTEEGNWCGFFEYDCWYKDLHVHARTLENLQIEMINLIKQINNSIKTFIKTKNWENKYYALSNEERGKISEYDYYIQLDSRELTNEELDSIKDKLYDENLSIIDNAECKIQYYKPTIEDLNELKELLNYYPNISQIELENLYYNHITTEPATKTYLSAIENNIRVAEQYDSDIAISSLLCDMYEKQLELESQLISTSEELVDLYEEKEKQ